MIVPKTVPGILHRTVRAALRRLLNFITSLYQFGDMDQGN
jgi:hypothetical protein